MSESVHRLWVLGRVGVVLSALFAAGMQPLGVSAASVQGIDYQGSPVVTYSIINAWPKKYTGVGN